MGKANRNRLIRRRALEHALEAGRPHLAKGIARKVRRQYARGDKNAIDLVRDLIPKEGT